MAAPIVMGISPTQGPTSGGTVVTITGSNFTGVMSVTFGIMPASFTVNSSAQITAFAPPHTTGSVDVRVTNLDGTSPLTPAGQYLYLSAVPAVTAVSPAQGPTAGGTVVTITGANLTGALGVSFGGMPASFTVNSPTQITAFAPAHPAGTVDIQVTTANGTSPPVAADQFLYVAAVPSVTAVTPAQGPTSGGTVVTITGTNLTGALGVSFGAMPAQFVVNSSTQITAFAPFNVAGTVHIRVSTSEGTTAATSADQYTYLP